MHVLIVEDEARIARRIARMTQAIFGDSLQSLSQASTLSEAQTLMVKQPVDLLLLDLNLNGASGFDLLRSAVSGAFHTIIISAYKEQAITAFEYGVLDFVPKPFNRARLEEAFNRVLTQARSGSNTVKFLAVRQRQRIQLIALEEVLYIKGAGPYTELFLTDGSKALHDKSLEKLEQLLSPAFFRIHKSYLVKLSEIRQIITAPGSKYLAQLSNETQVPIGRTKYKELRELWG